ncbi:MAG TPA: hypothetical protein VJ021_08530 [Thermoplasmata archaeon]|nr:hypothetical protein [Thermoplasmata archaeon]
MAKPEAYVITPFGDVPKSDMIRVPSGSAVVDDASVILPNGTRLNLPHQSGSRLPTLPDTHWIEYASWEYSPNNPTLDYSSAQWFVPASPTTFDGQLIYIFPGLESAATGCWIIQPVLQWGYNGIFGGNYWVLADWVVGCSGNIVTDPLDVPVTAQITGLLQGSSCQSSNGECNWAIEATEDVAGVKTGIELSGENPLNDLNAHWAALTIEAYDLDKCSDYPLGWTSFTSIALYCSSGSQLTPSWSPTINYTDCGQAVDIESSSDVSLGFFPNGHGGCVALGTPILTPRGYVQVQNLKAGGKIEEYILSSQSMTTGTFISGNTTQVNQTVDINNGWLSLTPTDQPIYIKNATFVGWLHDPQNLTTADSILDPVTQTWIHVVSVKLVDHQTTVYDVITSGRNNFVANGALLDEKGPP